MLQTLTSLFLRYLAGALLVAMLILGPLQDIAHAPPYDATISFTFPATAVPIDSVDLYMNDCAVGASVGSPVGKITSG